MAMEPEMEKLKLRGELLQIRAKEKDLKVRKKAKAERLKQLNGNKRRRTSGNAI